jgi:hypothetical protein
MSILNSNRDMDDEAGERECLAILFFASPHRHSHRSCLSLLAMADLLEWYIVFGSRLERAGGRIRERAYRRTMH